MTAETMELLRRKGLLSPQQLAEFLGIPIATVYGWRTRGEGPVGHRVGRHIRFTPEAVARWLDEQVDHRQPA